MSAVPLLLTEDAPAYGVLAGLRGLRSAGYEPWLAICGRDSYARRSRASAGVVEIPDASADRLGYAAALADAAERLQVAAVLPGTDMGLVALADSRDLFPAGVALGTSDPETVRLATDKRELERLAAQAGLRTPPSTHTTKAEVQALEVELPAIVKAPRTRTPIEDGFATSFVCRVSTREQLHAAADALPEEAVLIQPALDGELMAVAGVAWNGEVVAMTQQLARRIFPPGCGITAFAQSAPLEPSLADGVRRLIAMLSWSGIFQAQFICSQGDCYLIDLNPRMYGSLALAIASGVNLPGIWADLLVGRKPRVGAYRIGVRFRSEERDLALLASAIVARDYRTIAQVLRPRLRTAHALASLRDPVPLLLGGRIARIRRMLARGLL